MSSISAMLPYIYNYWNIRYCHTSMLLLSISPSLHGLQKMTLILLSTGSQIGHSNLGHLQRKRIKCLRKYKKFREINIYWIKNCRSINENVDIQKTKKHNNNHSCKQIFNFRHDKTTRKPSIYIYWDTHFFCVHVGEKSIFQFHSSCSNNKRITK